MYFTYVFEMFFIQTFILEKHDCYSRNQLSVHFIFMWIHLNFDDFQIPMSTIFLHSFFKEYNFFLVYLRSSHVATRPRYGLGL